MYEFIDHTGDIGVIVRAPTLEGLFSEAARAMMEIIADGSAARPQRSERIVVEGEDLAEVLRGWLGELLYRFSAGGMIFVEFAIDSVGERRLEARASGEPYDPARHPLRTELKAVTYHQLGVRRTDAGWEAQVIFDV
jgi:SHS2 domain-containing protein